MSNNKDLFDALLDSASNVVDEALGIEPKAQEETPIQKADTLPKASVNVFTGEVAELSAEPSPIFANEDAEEEIDWTVGEEELEADNDEYSLSHFDLDALTEPTEDNFEELLGQEFSEKLVTSKFKINDEVEERVVKQQARSFDITEEEEDKYQQTVDMLKSSNPYVDIDSEIPNIQEEEITEYIVMRGIYTTAFKEHILTSPIVSPGDFPICIEAKGKTIVYRRINPDPRTLFYLLRVFRGWEIKHVRNGEEHDLNIMYFLGKVKIGVV